MTGAILLQQHKARKARLCRLQATFGSLIQELDGEITRLKERKVSPEFIATKDAQLDQLINFYNEVEGMFNEMGAELQQLRMENMLSWSMINKGAEELLTTPSIDLVKKFKA